MNIKNIGRLIGVVFLILLACDEATSTENNNIVHQNGNGWLIPENEVRDGGPGKDGIPAITDPNFISPQEVDYLDDDDLVLMIKKNDEIKIYPHPILDWHEIINDKIGELKFALTYCPLTGSGIGWNRVLEGTETTFGVSGLLYNTNLIAYDRASNSNWSQMLNKSVFGELSSTEAETIPFIETEWKTVKSVYRSTQVVSKILDFHEIIQGIHTEVIKQIIHREYFQLVMKIIECPVKSEF